MHGVGVGGGSVCMVWVCGKHSRIKEIVISDLKVV